MPVRVLTKLCEEWSGVNTSGHLGTPDNSHLHGATPKAEHQMQGRLLLNVVIREGAPVLELFAGEDQPLLLRRNTLLVLDLCLDILDGVIRLDLQSDGLSRESLHEDLHGHG